MSSIAQVRSVAAPGRMPVHQFPGWRLLANVGAPLDGAVLPEPIAPSGKQLFAPRGLCLFAADGPLWVCDSGHHRVLGWRDSACADGAADWLIGQRDFADEHPNAGGDADGTTLRLPTGICRYRNGLAIADAWNHRVLIWHTPPTDFQQPADLVLGQADLRGAEPNRGAREAAPTTLHWPYGVAADGDRLVVADTGNRRVLLWHQPPAMHGAPAQVVLGQADGSSRDLDNGRLQPAALMRWPHGIVIADGRLMVADAGMHRILIWNAVPRLDGALPDIILGQRDALGAQANAGAAGPSASAFNMPYGITVSGEELVIADTCNSRLLAWPLANIGADVAANVEGDTAIDARAEIGPLVDSLRNATRVWGQADFHSRGDNAWQAPGPATLCWPYGVSACGQRLGIADTGNNRVQIWEAAP